MNQSKRVLYFTISIVCILLVLSFFPPIWNVFKRPFKNIDLLSDVRKDRGDSSSLNIVNGPDSASVPHHAAASSKAFSFAAYNRPLHITDFSLSDSTLPAMRAFTEKLAALKKGQKKKVRIAFFGDSMIEGDLISQDVRKSMQHTYGGHGVGFVSVQSIVAGFRTTAIHKFSNDWDDTSFKNAQASNNLFVSGHVYKSNGSSWFSVSDNTVADSIAADVSPYILYGRGSGSIDYNNSPVELSGNSSFNFQRLATGSKSAKITVSNSQLPVYGVSFESDYGVIVDNYSFRGITGIELKMLDSTLLTQIDKERPYDLIVLEYGVNLLFRPKDTNYDWYARNFTNVLSKLKRCFPNTQILILSTGDRAFRIDNQYQSGPGVPNLVETQATLAYNHQLAFFNLFLSMGGPGSIIQWANSTPAMANKDYVHPNHNGATKIAGYLMDAINANVDKVK